ncbi:MAG TPA: DUF2059 domain-containing protein [Xanthobacteraceae bacterium]|jgi:hypothetical protein|nr:DUF2059 domain-containing protein [Xanthobacteraceae bacterium]
MIANLSPRLVTRFAETRQAGMRFAAAALLALAVTGIAYPAAAQSPAPQAAAPQPSPGALLLGKQIVQVKGVKDVFEPIVRGVVQKTKDMFMQTNFMWGKDLNEVAFGVEKQFTPRISDLIDQSARIYASHFTEQELRDLLAFYQSPLGKKVLAEEPKVLDESMVYAGTWADNLSTEVITAMRIEMKKRGHDM